MVGWAAVTGDVSLASAVMFAIIFFWTPPHFWALSLRLKDDYADAGVPMLPVTDGVIETRLQVLRYSVLLVIVTLLLWPAAELSWIYFGTALATGAAFVWLAFLLWRRPAEQNPMTLYKYSLLYLAVLFTSMGLDAALL
jgi:protoheme IX farnesyltransferase